MRNARECAGCDMKNERYMTPGMVAALKARANKHKFVPYTKIEVKQGQAEWLMRRMGHITSTRVRRILSDRDETYNRLLSEMIEEYHQLTPHGYYYQSDAMDHGNICEPEARKLASIVADEEFYETGFCVYKKLPILADSNDGLTADGKVVLEAKCPYTAKTFNELKAKGIPNYHYMQCQAHMLVTGAEKCLYLALYSGEGIEFFKDQAYHYEWVWPDQGMIQKILHRARSVDDYLNKHGYVITDKHRISGLYQQNLNILRHEVARVERYQSNRRRMKNAQQKVPF